MQITAELELPKLRFQVIRRTIATFGTSKGHVKDIQVIMPHTRASKATDVYMQSLEPEVRTAVNSIYDELMGSGTDRLSADESRKRSVSSRSKSEKPVGDAAQQSSQRAPRAAAKRAEAKPVRGVVLEFATRMRQSRGREMLLKD